VGTPLYIPPEILCNEAYDTSANVWSLGVLIYELVSSSNPWDLDVMATPLSRMKYKIINVKPIKPKKMSDTFFDLISKMLTPRKQRISVDDALKHPIFKNIDFSNLFQEDYAIPCMAEYAKCVESNSLHKRFHSTKVKYVEPSYNMPRVANPNSGGIGSSNNGMEEEEEVREICKYDTDAFLRGELKKVEGTREEGDSPNNNNSSFNNIKPRPPLLESKSANPSPSSQLRVLA